MNIGDIIIIIALALALYGAIRIIRRGGGGCSGDCGSCSKSCKK